MFTYDLGDGASLQILEMRHAPEFLEFVDENRAYLGEWMSWDTTMQTLEDAQNFIKRGLSRFSDDGIPWVGIWLNGRMVGGIHFSPIDPRVHSTEVGYWLGQSATGRGLMTRALKAMLHYAFDLLHVNRVGLQADVRNSRSRAVAERLGFTFEGIRRQSLEYKGQLIDIATYSLLAQEWREQTPQ
ncbi:GNAT family N-acetyltransferase [Ktedonobacter sp. SOSP1-85]|uniref:GNAT family N-acetyltransferase n=1 Tax=Ktedonobacter sp. SOSP1-85 TaxID=2778367 RepID=UPI0019160649|nr:GNAT family protein [Ktedonobacter sp. SOSP1-85]GHO78020.1 GNAT family N-acetyltransferase [Ktedonobacter sp. SOSP1-85]